MSKNNNEEFDKNKQDLWDKITDGKQHIQDPKRFIKNLRDNISERLPSEPLSDKEIYDRIIAVAESIPVVEPVQPFMVGGALFSVLKSAPEFTQEYNDDVSAMTSSITGMIGNITIICDAFIKNDDPNIYQFKDGMLTVVAKVTGLDEV